MNKSYRLIWSRIKEAWVVVSEKVAAKGARPALTIGCLTAAATFATSGMALALDPGALPTGGRIAAGSAVISQSGTSMTVDQQTSRMIATWDTFNIGQNASVRFNQPGSSSVALNRIAGQSPSQILGNLSANGQVFLLNPAGIVFGRNARVDVGSLVASSLDMTNADFLAGDYRLTGDGGGVLNQGSITTADGGVVALVGERVGNEGTIATPDGGTALIGGTDVTLDFTGDGLINYSIDQGAVDAQAENKGLIAADGGVVVMTAQAADALTQSVVNNEGVIEASSLANRGGRIILGGDLVVNTGSADASGASGGAVTANADYLMNAGSVTVTGDKGDGGDILLKADRIVQTDEATLDASGTRTGGDISLIAGAGKYDGIFSSAEMTATGKQGGNLTLAGNRIDLRGATLDASGVVEGGDIRVGGDLHGGEWSDPISGEALVNSQITDISPENSLDASASAGDGGSVVVWSEEKTYFYGNAAATGTTNGGFIEISSKDRLQYGGLVDASSPGGETGTVLFDPKDIVIDDAAGGGDGTTYTAFVNPNPSADSEFGSYITTLSTGNMVVTDAYADVGGVTNAGAVYLFETDGTLISTLTGSHAEDQVSYDYTNWQGGTVALTNGNFAVSSPAWDGFKGSVTWGDGTTGVSGIVSSANSLVGSQANDRVGSSGSGWNGVYALTNGNYVVTSPYWANGANAEAGAATWVNGSTGQTMNATNTISSANSLIGSAASDWVGYKYVAVLTNGNYAVVSPWWDNGATTNAGAVTWGNGSTGTAGTISSANSLVGTRQSDSVGMGEATALTNGNYVVSSFYWHDGANVQVGAATWVNGSNGQTMNAANTISAANSLVGSTLYDNIGMNNSDAVVALSNGNYVVVSRYWDNGGFVDAGAATWGDGTNGSAGAISSANSLVGDKTNDDVGGGGAVALTNGNYVVLSPYWNNGAVADAGAVTWGNGATGTTGAVSAANSLVGSASMDFASTRLVALSNGNYVFASPYWGGFKGMAAWGDGSTGGPRLVGTVSAANALIGTKTGDQYRSSSSANAASGDQVGDSVYALSNGNYVVSSPLWTNGSAGVGYGAVTWGDGSAGIVGTISAANSLVGSQANDFVGSYGVTTLNNGNYVVGSPLWNNGGTADVGAATWGDGTTGIVGTISAANSLIGSTASDKVSYYGIAALDNGNYVVSAHLWDNGADVDAGAVTWADGTTGLAGTISSDISLIGAAGKQLGTLVVAGAGDIFGAVDSNYAGGGVYSVSSGSSYSGGLNFADNADQSVTLTSASLTDVLNTGSNVILQANNDITVSSAVTASNAGGDGGNLTMQAGRSILLNADIATDNGDLTLVANETAANGVVDAQRDAGAAAITMAGGTGIDAGSGTVSITLADGAGKTNTDSGDISLRNISAGALSVTNDGPTAGSDISLNGTTTVSGDISVETTAANSNVTIVGNIVKSSGLAASATFKATGNILLESSASIGSSGNPLSILLWSDSDADGGGIWVKDGATLQSRGGAVTLSGGLDYLSGYAKGTMAIDRTPFTVYNFKYGERAGILLEGDIDSGGGNVLLRGEMGQTGAAEQIDSGALYLSQNASVSSGTGDIELIGRIGADSQSTFPVRAVRLGDGASSTAKATLVTTSGAIRLDGAADAASTGRAGVLLDSARLETTNGAITLTGIQGSGEADIVVHANTLDGNTSSNVVTSTGGDITLTVDSLSIINDSTFSSTGGLTIQPRTAGTTIGVAGGAGTLQLPAGYFSTNFVDGFSDITMGNATAGLISIGGTALSYQDSLILKTGNSIFFDVASAVTGNGNDFTLWTRAGGNDAADDGIEGAVWMPIGSSIDTGGGDVVIGGGSDPTIGYALGDNAAPSDESNARYRGVTINGTLDAGGGNVSILGRANGQVSYTRGTSIGGTGAVTTSGSGTIAISGIAKGSSDGLGVSAGGTISSGSGEISLAGIKDTGYGINLSGSITSSTGNLILNSTGAISGPGVVTVGGTTTITAGASNVTLTNTVNDFAGAVSVVSAGNLSLIDSDTLSLGAVSASGTIDIATLAGNLTLTDAVNSDDTTSGAVILNAGKSTAAGTATGGNLIVSGGSVGTGAGGRATLYSGSVAGSTGLTALIGSGSGKFRYNSDESASNYSIALGTGIYAIYREQPTLTYTADNKTMTYGGTIPALTTALSGLQNGDTSGQAISTSATVGVGGSTSSTGNYTAGDHALTSSGAAGGLGYGFSYTAGTLTVNKKAITASGITAANKVYDSTPTATLDTGSAALTGGAAADDDNKYYAGDTVALDVSGASGAFADKNVDTGKAVTVTGLALTGADAGNYTVSDDSGATADIIAKAITASGITAANKVYDSTPTATLDTGSAALTGGAAADDDNKYYAGDTVALDVSGASGAFADKNVDTGKAVTVTGLALTGADAGNYTVSDDSGATADITAKAITASGISAADKVYDSTPTATLNTGAAGLTGGAAADDDNKYYTGDTVSLDVSGASGAFADKNVGIGKAVTVGGLALTGADAGNYTVSDGSGATADITAKAITASGISASNKIYDGTDAATVNSAGAVLIGLVDGDTVTVSATGTFSDKNVGIGKTVTLASSYGGIDVGNYAITDQASTTATITQKALTLGGIITSNKVYDGTSAATLNTAGVTFTGLIGGDTVTLGGDGTGTFIDKNVGTNKTVIVSGYTLVGSDAGNYAVGQPTGLTADITPASLLVSGITASNKIYDSTDAAIVNTAGAVLTGLIGGDTVTVSATGTFSDKNVGTGKTVTLASGYGGADAGNYTITDQVSAIADISSKTLTASGITANNKVYDGTGIASLNTGAAGLAGGAVADDDNKYYTGDAISLDVSSAAGAFADKNVGTGKVVTVSGLALTGADAGNYTVSDGSGASADITPKSVTVTGLAADNKVYDGTTDVTISNWGFVVTGVGTETLTLNHGSASFSDKNAGTGKTITADGYSLGDGANGGLASNYTLSSTSAATSADILKKAITLTADAKNKTYGDADPTLTYGTDVATVGGDSFTGMLGRVVGEDVGAYAISRNTLAIADGNAGDNYVLSYIGNELMIAQRAIGLSADPTCKILGAAEPTLSVSISSGSLGAVTVNDRLADVVGILSRESGENIGRYDILLGVGAKAGNYAISFDSENNAFAIEAAPLPIRDVSEILSSLTSTQTQVNGTQEQFGADGISDSEAGGQDNLDVAMGPGGSLSQEALMDGLIVDRTGYADQEDE